MKFMRSSRTSRMTSRASTESWRTLQNAEQPIRRIITDGGLETSKGAVRQFRKGTSAANESHADQVCGSGSKDIEQDSASVA